MVPVPPFGFATATAFCHAGEVPTGLAWAFANTAGQSLQLIGTGLGYGIPLANCTAANPTSQPADLICRVYCCAQ